MFFHFLDCFDFPLTAEVEDVFKLGSMKPGAMLYDASKEYEVQRMSVVTLFK